MNAHALPAYNAAAVMRTHVMKSPYSFTLLDTQNLMEMTWRGRCLVLAVKQRIQKRSGERM